MKVQLLFCDRSADPEQPLPANADDLKQDLELDTLLDVMAAGDAFLREQAERGLLTSLTTPDEVRYRQDVLRDCLDHPDAVRQLYAIAIDALDSKQKTRHFWFRDSPEQLLAKSVRMLELLTENLRQLRQLAETHRTAFTSDGCTALFALFEGQLDEPYLASIDEHVRELAFRRGTLISAKLGRGNRGTDYMLRKPHGQRLLERLSPNRPPSHSFTLPARDEHGMETLAAIRNHGINRAADALAQSVDHILGFFATLRAELGFYLACLNLHEQLQARTQPTCFPDPAGADTDVFNVQGLYDASLVFHLDGRVVGNDVGADRKRLIMVTGANQGGKSTFLRSAGSAQLLMQAGCFVPAVSFSANVADGLFTHFKREEDATMTRGKLDEELNRMSTIADLIRPRSLLLCNESFASTNEREGSEIARQMIKAMLEGAVKIVYVTHLFDLADSLHRQQLDNALFLRAERKPDGTRTFRLTPGQPLPTSFGEDSYQRIFGKEEPALSKAAKAG
ncbi:MAG: MutS-related protein [Burkholderiales bacterium]